MQINKKDFKVILNHMNSLSPLENKNLIKQTHAGKTNNNDINQLINTYSPHKVSKLMNKINDNFLININMYGGANNVNTSKQNISNQNILDIINRLQELKKLVNICSND